MRLWSIHPKYLDSKGLVALWREGLLAQKVLLGETKGYKNHPQLERFKKCKYSIRTIGEYLTKVWEEANYRKYQFDCTKIEMFYYFPLERIEVTRGQLEYEWMHLENKLCDRNSEQFDKNCKYMWGKDKEIIQPHPLFKVIEGDIESWEKI